MLNCGRILAGTGLLLTALLSGCGGGGGSPADVSTHAPATGPVLGADTFLLFPNPQVQPDGSLQTNTVAYSNAYYAAIDPAKLKDTLDKWKAVNGFDNGTGTQISVVFGDVRDLGYGRRMTARQNPDGTVAILVENFLVQPAAGYAYSNVNLQAAAIPDRRWHLANNSIEFSPGPGGGASFAKFFNFDPLTGARQATVDLDGRGEKAMPGPCISCHGGRADPLTPPGPAGQPLFPLLQTAVSLSRGDTQAQLVPIEVDAVDFLATSPYTRAEQEAALKTLNRMVLCTYPIPAATGLPEDACRRVASVNEWQGAASELIKNGYGGDGLPNPAFSDTYVPAGWLTVGQSSLYQNVVAQTCRSCHFLRGTKNQSDIDLDSYAKFVASADRIKYHVIDAGNMPLSRLPYARFWNTGAADALATFLEGQGFTVRDSTGAVLRPGRPVADPGPDRTVRQGPTVLSATGSLFASTYAWTLVSGPNGTIPPTGATLTNSGSAQPTFSATADGTYVLQLVAGNGNTLSAPRQLTVLVNNALAPAPASIRFADIKAALQSVGCTACHTTSAFTPIAFTSIDRNGDSTVNATDDIWFYTEVRGRINFLDRVGSPLLRKPSGNHHGGGLRPGFDTSQVPGHPARATYDLFLNWVLNDAPQ